MSSYNQKVLRLGKEWKHMQHRILLGNITFDDQDGLSKYSINTIKCLTIARRPLTITTCSSRESLCDNQTSKGPIVLSVWFVRFKCTCKKENWLNFQVTKLCMYLAK